MTKAELVQSISESTGVPKVDVLVTVESLFKHVKDRLAESESVHIRGFGSFMLRRRAEKKARNIRLGQSVMIPEHTVPFFKPSPEFVNIVREVMPNANSQEPDIE